MCCVVCCACEVKQGVSQQFIITDNIIHLNISFIVLHKINKNVAIVLVLHNCIFFLNFFLH